VDIVAQGVTVPQIGYLGSPFDTIVTVSNLHALPVGPFVIQLFAGMDAAALTGPIIGSSTISLAAFETRGFTMSITAPLTLQPGAYWVVLVADPRNRIAEVNESNNRTASTTSVQLYPAKPDLTVVRVASSAASIRAGGSVTVTSSVANIGSLSLTGAPFAVVLSTNPVATGADLVLATFEVDLPFHRAMAHTSSVTIPADAESGVYYLGTVADPNNVIDEIDESNNGAIVRTPVIVGGSNLAIATTKLPTAVLQKPYSAFLAPISGGPGYHWRVAQGSLPPGLVLEASTGEIHGLATAPGMSTFTIGVDSNGRSASTDLTISVVPPNEPLTVVTRRLPYGIAGIEYSFQLEATLGTTTGTISWTGSGLPRGLTLSTGGLIAGTPAAASTSTVNVAVSSGMEMSGRSLVLTVRDSGALAITPDPLPHAMLGQPYQHSFGVIGGLQPITWSVDQGALPPPLSLTADGQIVGTPVLAGSFTFVVEAEDNGVGVSVARDTATFELCVDDMSQGLSIATPSLPDGVVNEGYDQHIHAVGGASPYSWKLESGGLPAGLLARPDPATGDLRIAGQPIRDGTSNMLVSVMDAMGRRAARAFAIRVLAIHPIGAAASKKSCGCREATHGGASPWPPLILPILGGLALTTRARTFLLARGCGAAGSATSRPADRRAPSSHAHAAHHPPRDGRDRGGAGPRS
jgi:hypothetical protein